MEFPEFCGKRVLISGASGLIGGALTRALVESGATVVALARNERRSREAFKELPEERIEYLTGDVCELQPRRMDIDYIVHGASATSSRAFIEEPVSVIMSAVLGTRNMLEVARVNPLKGFVYLSSMEVYGTPLTDEKIDENFPSSLDPTKPRSGYPEGKRLCECLCCSYAAQYGVPSKIVRLTQTFGEGVRYDDTRVFAEFARCVIEGRDIVLKTAGQTKRNYLYTGDAADAILTVLLRGGTGVAYNAANEDTYCSIYDMARLVADSFGGGKCKVRVCEEDAERLGYAPTLKMNLDCSRLRALGWSPKADLKQTYARMIDYMRAHRGE